MLLVEHDMDVVFAVADRLTVLVEGTVIASGAPARCAPTPPCARPISEGRVNTGEPPLLAAEQLHAYYGAEPYSARRRPIKSRRGETLGLMGRNGMGKTTLLRTLMGLVRPSGADAYCSRRRRDTRAADEVAPRGIAYVPEGRGIFASLTVAENLVMAARAGADGATWTAGAHPRRCSRGWPSGSPMGATSSPAASSRCSRSARALMTNPRILILDEATEGLAPLIRESIWKTVRLVRESGVARCSSTRASPMSPQSPTA